MDRNTATTFSYQKMGLKSKKGSPLTNGIESKLAKIRADMQKKASAPRRESAEEDRRVNALVRELNSLKGKYPGSPKFLGKDMDYPKKKERFLFFFHRREPNLGDLREEVNKFSEKKELTDPRKKIKKLLKSHPRCPDLRAINGIQIFNDAAQSGLDAKKINVLEGALIEIGRAIHNEGISIFNTTWFIKIYVRYLEFLRDKIQIEYSSSIEHYHRDVRQAAEELNRTLLQLASMLSIRDKLGGLQMLNAKLKGSTYIIESVTRDEIRSASTAMLHGDGDKKIGTGKTANYIQLVLMTLSLLYARIPILRKLVANILTVIPDVSKDLILQKKMISTMSGVTDFQLSLASGDRKRTKEIAENMFDRCADTIQQHLEYSVLTKLYEVDPFLKAGWIAKESNGLYSEADYRKKLDQAMSYLEVVVGNRGQLKGSFELARQLQNEIHFIMVENGWASLT